MSFSILPEKYLELQKKIVKMQSEWQKEIEIDEALPKKWPLKTDGIPLTAEIPFHIDSEQYQQWLKELGELVIAYDSRWKEDIETLLKLAETETSRWTQEALACNTYFFEQLAEKEGVAIWLPQFLAEHATRPFLRQLAKVYGEELEKIDHHHHGTGCPICGEPIRLAKMERLGRKALVCPRCEAAWHENRIVCSHCGTRDPKSLKYFTVEDDDTVQLHVCEECYGYLKVVDDRKRLKKERPALIDVTTLHMDLVAQQRGYGLDPTAKKREN